MMAVQHSPRNTLRLFKALNNCVPKKGIKKEELGGGGGVKFTQKKEAIYRKRYMTLNT